MGTPPQMSNEYLAGKKFRVTYTELDKKYENLLTLYNKNIRLMFSITWIVIVLMIIAIGIIAYKIHS